MLPIAAWLKAIGEIDMIEAEAYPSDPDTPDAGGTGKGPHLFTKVRAPPDRPGTCGAAGDRRPGRDIRA